MERVKPVLENSMGPAVLEGGRLGTSLKLLEGMDAMVFPFHDISLHFNSTSEFRFNPCLFLATCKALNLVFCPTMGQPTRCSHLTINHLTLAREFDFFFQLVQRGGPPGPLG